MAFRVVWPFAVAGGVLWTTGRYGFSPTDDEFILAGSWRILNGQIPHRDIVSARPIGASILHLLDFALPGPLFLDGRFTTALEFVLIAGALLVLALRGAGVGRVGGLGRAVFIALGATAVAMVNLQTFPLTPWHTVDGLACTAAGWFLIDDGLEVGSAGRRRFGLFLTGFAAICKQSFALAPVIALGMLVLRRGFWRSSSRSVRTVDALMLLVAPVAYLVWIALAGGLHDALRQLSSSPLVWGQPMITGLWHPALFNLSAIATGIMFLAAVCGWGFSRTWPGAAVLYTVCAAEISIALVGTMLGTMLGEPTGSGIAPFGGRSLEASALVWWMCVVLIVADALVERRVFFPALATCALAWMASLSWGYALPALLQGSVTACALILIWRDKAKMFWAAIPCPRRIRRVALAVVLSMVTSAVVATVLTQRAAHEYRDGPRVTLSADLVTAAADGRGIRTSTATAAYLQQLSRCVKGHPAAWTAILPDSAAAYPLLGLHNPFPADWIVPQELVGDAESRILKAADRLDRTGDYLILFRDEDPLLERIRERLTAEPVRCGSLFGVWDPHPAEHAHVAASRGGRSR